MNKIGLFLDDERNPEDVTWVDYPDDIEWYVVRRMNDFLFVIMTCEFDYISFDHDINDYNLLDKENTGYDCLKQLVDWLIASGFKTPKCFFHTQNPVGKKNMEAYYNNFIKHLENK